LSESLETASTLPLFIDLQTRYLQNGEPRDQLREIHTYPMLFYKEYFVSILQRQMKNIYGEISCKTSVSDQDIYRMESQTYIPLCLEIRYETAVVFIFCLKVVSNKIYLETNIFID
jgi:hypothetical protein